MGIIPAVSPAAFVSLLLFALLAAVIIQGPLGLRSAFSGESPASVAGHSHTGSISLTGLLEILSAKLPGFSGATATASPVHGDMYTHSSFGPLPQMAGQGSSSNKDGHSQWNWFANPRA